MASASTRPVASSAPRPDGRGAPWSCRWWRPPEARWARPRRRPDEPDRRGAARLDRLHRRAGDRRHPRGGRALQGGGAGAAAVGELAALDGAEVVLNGVTGSVGLLPTLRALEAGRRLALANKESLIVGGPLVASRARPGQIVPVDSEHSALAQCLRAGAPDEVARLVITASGGPFRGRSAEELADVSP